MPDNDLSKTLSNIIYICFVREEVPKYMVFDDASYFL